MFLKKDKLGCTQYDNLVKIGKKSQLLDKIHDIPDDIGDVLNLFIDINRFQSGERITWQDIQCYCIHKGVKSLTSVELDYINIVQNIFIHHVNGNGNTGD